MSTTTVASFSDLLRSAVEDPSVISKAYSTFHNYSFGNQLLAWAQCVQRGIPPGPLATFPRWKELDRHVKRGEKAITLCQPVTIKRNAESVDGEQLDDVCFTRFVYRPHWFVLAHTEGKDMAAVPVPAWNRTQALASLDIAEEPFAHLNGNCQGYARERRIAVSPVVALPRKTCFHEIAHELLGHTAEHEQADTEITPRDLSEAEAECIAMLGCAGASRPPGGTRQRAVVVGGRHSGLVSATRGATRTAPQWGQSGRNSGPS